MKGIHKLMPLPEDMKATIGAAVVCYAMAEAAAKNCCEALKPGLMAWADDKTGGDIAKRLGTELDIAGLNQRGQPMLPSV